MKHRGQCRPPLGHCHVQIVIIFAHLANRFSISNRACSRGVDRGTSRDMKIQSFAINRQNQVILPNSRSPESTGRSMFGSSPARGD